MSFNEIKKSAKNKLRAIKTKFDYATCAGSKFEKKVQESLELVIGDKYKTCAKQCNWSPDNLRFNGEATDNTITITISAPIPKPNITPPPDLIKSVIDEAKNALKSAANKHNTSISQYNWKDPTTTCSPSDDKDELVIRIMGNEKSKNSK